jgi:hypothetical protein
MNLFNIEELSIWLDNPATKGFIKLLETEYDKRLSEATRLSLNEFHKKDKSESAVKLYGQVHGIHIIRSYLQTLVDDIRLLERAIEPKEQIIPNSTQDFLNIINNKIEL